MPYSQYKLRCLQGMGIVPWIVRDTRRHNAEVQTLVNAVVHAEQMLAAAEPTYSSAESVQAAPGAELMHQQLVEIPFRGQRCTQLGKADAPLLILVESISHQQQQYPFESADAKIFEDMLRAISWRRQDVCLGVLPPLSTTNLLLDEAGPCVADLCKTHRDAVLLFRLQLPDSLDTNDLILPFPRDGMMAWQIPHPALLRASPARKRQAWNVLKAARACLG